MLTLQMTPLRAFESTPYLLKSFQDQFHDFKQWTAARLDLLHRMQII